MGVGAEAVGAWTLPNRSLTGWVGPAFDEVGELTEKAFQSPNSPFPLDEAAAVRETVVDKSSHTERMACKLLWQGEGMFTSGGREAGGGRGRGEVSKATDEI